MTRENVLEAHRAFLFTLDCHLLNRASTPDRWVEIIKHRVFVLDSIKQINNIPEVHLSVFEEIMRKYHATAEEVFQM
jgi:hypothetical protein